MRGMLLPGGRRLDTSVLRDQNDSISQASLLWVSAVGMRLRSRRSTFALPLFLVIGWGVMNIHGFCDSI